MSHLIHHIRAPCSSIFSRRFSPPVAAQPTGGLRDSPPLHFVAFDFVNLWSVLFVVFKLLIAGAWFGDESPIRSAPIWRRRNWLIQVSSWAWCGMGPIATNACVCISSTGTQVLNLQSALINCVMHPWQTMCCSPVSISVLPCTVYSDCPLWFFVKLLFNFKLHWSFCVVIDLFKIVLSLRCIADLFYFLSLSNITDPHSLLLGMRHGHGADTTVECNCVLSDASDFSKVSSWHIFQSDGGLSRNRAVHLPSSLFRFALWVWVGITLRDAPKGQAGSCCLLLLKVRCSDFSPISRLHKVALLFVRLILCSVIPPAV